MKFTIIGQGAFGTAVGGILEKNHFEVVYYDPYKLPTTLEEALEGANAVVLAVPSEAAPEILPKLPTGLPLIVTTKGFLSLELLQDFTDLMALSGPGFAADIKKEEATILTVTDSRLKTWLARPWLRFDQTNDILGVLLCGALKNVYAIAAGIKKLTSGTLERKEFIGQATKEMRLILTANGADPATVDCACGRGDLELTCGMPSRNYEFGVEVANDPGRQPEKTVEGLTVLMKINAGGLKVPDEAGILKSLLERTWA